MPTFSTFALVNGILGLHAQALGPDLPAYRNHVTRVLHFVFAIAPPLQNAPLPILIAGSFHDLGIWTAQTFDYVGPSSKLAHDYMKEQDWSHCVPKLI